jgi:hypothetical protein
MSQANIDRRSLIKGIALTGAAVVTGSSLPGQAQAMFDKGIEVGALSKLAKDYDTIPFTLGDGTKALLVRVPAPKDKAMLKMGHVVKSGKVHLSAYTLVCTHNSCEPAAPNAEVTARNSTPMARSTKVQPRNHWRALKLWSKPARSWRPAC